LTPVVNKQVSAVVVKGSAEDEDVQYISDKQSDMVWHKDVGGCASWVNTSSTPPACGFSFILAWVYCSEAVVDFLFSIMMKKPVGMIYCFQIFRLNSI
jgi:hypothetical protein